jgi:flagellar hook-length control protein FliK
MSTVTTSNIERSPTFVSKHASAKNQAPNPIANAFASLLMAAEEDGSASFTDALDPLATDRATDPRIPDPEVTVALADPGQAALAGLLNWQTLTTAGNTAQAANGSTELAGDSATSERSTRQSSQDSLMKLTVGIAAPATNLDATDITGWPLTQKGLSAPGKLGVDSLPLTKPSPLTSPVLAPASATTALQPTPSRLSVDSLPLTTPSTLASPANTPALTTSTLQPTLNVPTPTLGAPALEQSSSRNGAIPETTVQPPGVQQHSQEALVAGIQRASTAKSRSSGNGNQLQTSTLGAAGGKTGASAALQNNLSAPAATEVGMSPRATVDLAARTATEAEPGTNEGGPPKAESTSLRADGARPSADSTHQGTDHVQPSEQPAGPIASVEPTSMTGQAAENMADIMDELSGQVAYWAAQGTQRANLTVGGDRDNPLEVSIAMRDGEVHVAFEAAQDDIREALTTNAEALLRNMLESKGMTLGDVTVGQRPPSPDQGAATPQERNGQNPDAAARMAPTAPAGATRTGQGISAPMLRRPDIATTQKVDLFA